MKFPTFVNIFSSRKDIVKEHVFGLRKYVYQEPPSFELNFNVRKYIMKLPSFENMFGLRKDILKFLKSKSFVSEKIL